MRLVAVGRLGGRLGRRARAMALEAAHRRARDAAREPLGLLPSTSMLGRTPPGIYEVADDQDLVIRSGKIDAN